MEILSFRNFRLEEYAEQEKQLNDRKEALFKTKDIKKWEFDGDMIELIGRKDVLLKEPKKAFAFILSKESKVLKESKERCNFFTN